MELSSVIGLQDATARLARRRPDGTPVYTYRRLPGLPPVSVLRFRGGALPEGLPHGAHAHDFLVVAYFDVGGGSIVVNGRDWPVSAGDALVIAPGEVIAPGRMLPPEAAIPPGGAPRDAAPHDAAPHDAAPHDAAPHDAGEHRAWSHAGSAWAAFFPLDVLGQPTATALQSWQAHPLLFPFLTGVAGVQRLNVPPEVRAAWSDRFAALERELIERRDGYSEAALAHLTLLLVGIARLVTDIPGDLALREEPLLATVFNMIEARYAEPVSLQHVAAAAGLSAGHLTTVVGRKTGRTVQQWITERRMSEARRLLAGTDLTVETVAARVGYRDVSYFIRTFKRAHGVTPLQWRRAGRS